MDQGQQQGQPGAGTQAAGILLPLATLAAGIMRPQTAPAFAALGQQAHYLGQQQQTQADRERELAGQAATADQYQALGLPVSKDMPVGAQHSFATLMDARAKEQALVSQKRIDEARKQRGENAYGAIAGLEGQIGNELPDTLRQSLQNLAPSATLSPDSIRAFERAQTGINESAKRLSTANALARPFQTQEQVDLNQPAPGSPTASLMPGGTDYSLGTSGSQLTVPPMTWTKTPDNVHALQRNVMETGVVPKPEDAATQFGLPVSKLPGGVAAAREAVKPPYAPHVSQTTNAAGQVTNLAVSVDPNTGQPVLQHTVVPGPGGGPAGQPQQPPSLNQAEILNSLGSIIAGRGPTLPIHQGLTPETASTIVDTMRRANAQASPDLAAALIIKQRDEAKDQLDKVDLRAQGAKNDKDRMQWETKRDQLKLKVDEYDRALQPFIQSGLRDIAPQGKPKGQPTPSGNPNADAARKALRDAGVIK
jgi:hypothetical protein